MIRSCTVVMYSQFTLRIQTGGENQFVDVNYCICLSLAVNIAVNNVCKTSE